MRDYLSRLLDLVTCAVMGVLDFIFEPEVAIALLAGSGGLAVFYFTHRG